MKASLITLLLTLGGFTSVLTAGPEIYDPLDAYKRPNSLSVRPVREIVTAGNVTESARFTYDGALLTRIDYFGMKDIPAGYVTFAYDKGNLAREQLFDAGGKIAEEIRYQYNKAGRLEKSLIQDVRANAKIEWHYLYDKEGTLVGGKRLLDGKVTESFKLVPSTAGVTQNIYNAKGELTSRVDSIIEKGVLRSRVKTGLVGARYADYRYNDKGQLVEIIYYDTVRGEKTLVKKHHFDYSLSRDLPKTALR